EDWVRDRALSVLEGHAREVASGIYRRATAEGLATSKRKKADETARYLKNKAPYLGYPTALASGWPIATGIIEGAVRHVVRDRMDVTGARWSVDGAEAVLKLRAVRANGDFDDYWRFHLDHERHRVHESRYDRGIIPLAA
ncbi:MAG: ISKra4 family transposase, partial [Actinomycetota bacterium]|nr:ISKra4 family transposase [Actinomycetota bacterium]